ncbi:MAG: LytR C-terminal domain-containing protein [candidate division WOR-3 bacterium]|nr:LytR C-terminal domain-containing protein [candidate division WOR-3 bacterium]
MKKIIAIILIVIIILIAGFFYLNHLRRCKYQPRSEIDRSKIRIEVINCSGVDKQGMRACDYLRSVGFDVYEVRASNRLLDKTTVIERVAPDLHNAYAVSEVLYYLKKSRPIPIKTLKILPEIQKDIDSSLYLEVTVVLGKDCEKFLPKPELSY